ncbi:MAG: hypothetical protein H6832_10280 [Planctomycetes bacterium]|nr:hypothetical protein [Planctomycetota bacterium]MCB9918776.1 hypothetical protein [Planctomycetota bacterium]
MQHFCLPSILLVLVTGSGCATTGHATIELATTTVIQRTSEDVRVADSKVKVTIGDITAGQVLTRLDAGEECLLGQRPMKPGDSVPFRLRGIDLDLGMSRMVNLLFGDDYATFYLGTKDDVARAQIHDFLERIAESKFRFVIGTREVDGHELARALERDVARRSSPPSAKEFLDDIAVHPAGKPRYGAIVRDETYDIARWLRSSLY